jgi:hypothetical protein
MTVHLFHGLFAEIKHFVIFNKILLVSYEKPIQKTKRDTLNGKVKKKDCIYSLKRRNEGNTNDQII